ncbi:S9 family peptidase [Chitinophaga japonensis]|uniref:Dipeptidyl-peptidase-4 n=1 Tax=Chitinophaga japonensis TaxID=104662 RepID=A0A562SYZ4_CHIJA|nr:S9 family peptidase [Chitinophaga japonensis]TWI86527.1 dipeptidyl-peptidase-4 [Chitinophaga japonensis]
MQPLRYTLIICICLFSLAGQAQPGRATKWSRDGQAIYSVENGAIVATALKDGQQQVKIPAAQLVPAGGKQPLELKDFAFSPDERQLLVYTNSQRVWRYETRGDYWLLDLESRRLRQLGKTLPPASLMFAKFSPDGRKAAYVSQHNLYMEDLATGEIKQLTQDGSRRLINGTFDWAYEEEFSCRDGFRWSPDSRRIAYWQIDATKIRDFLMIDYTDSIYSFTVPVEYPKAGQSPSACRVGVVDINTAATTWMQVPGDPQQHYIPRMEWVPGKNELILQQLNRKQNHSVLMLCNAASGMAKPLFEESDEAWIDIKSRWNDDDVTGWEWIRNGEAFIWVSEKDGWRHLYTISMKDGKATLITPGEYDVITISRIDEAHRAVYILASPDNATQQYLYRVSIDGKGKPQRITPADQPGTHEYEISPDAAYAIHRFSNHYFYPATEIVHLPGHKSNSGNLAADIKEKAGADKQLEFFTVTTADGVEIGGWMKKPNNFDPAKKYPVVFYVYGEPAGATARDQYGAGRNYLYQGDMAADGYIYVSMDNRGTPLPKGREWRKSIYRKVGVLNARDQAQAATALMQQRPYMDTSRVAVWGWSGGGSMTLNLLFQYPKIYKTGIAIAAVGNQLTYDNIYQERYMGLPQENMEDFVKGSPITYAQHLQGHLLYIHGTGDDNVHYQNAEMLLNELIRHNKLFQFMAYPNRTHGISEGAGTRRHLSSLYTRFLQQYCPPGPR